MQSPRRRFVYVFSCLCAVLIMQALGCASFPVPNSHCHAFDNSRRFVDFSCMIGKEYEYVLKDNTDLVVRFCKSVETRSQSIYGLCNTVLLWGLHLQDTHGTPGQWNSPRLLSTGRS